MWRSTGERRQCSFALVSKVRNYGGDFEIARSVTLLDDQFEVVLFEGAHGDALCEVLRRDGAQSAGGMSGVTVLRADRVTISAADDRRAYVQIDGEFGGTLPAEIADRAGCADAAGAGGVRGVGATLFT